LKLYFLNLLIGFDEFINTLFGGAPSETISGRSARAKEDGKLWGKVLCKFLDWLQPCHCAKALENNEKGRHEEALDLE
jgi:hypothetical protein